MARKPTEMCVVAGALADPAGRWLMQKRPLSKHHGGLWEFPGGKIEPGETPRAALARELYEELTITADAEAMRRMASASAAATAGNAAIVLSLYTVPEWRGVPRAEEGAEIGWFARDAIAALDMPPLDAVLARALPPQG